jgi:hypothetical protein
VIYALGTTLVPGFALRTPPMEFLSSFDQNGESVVSTPQANEPG